MKTIKVKDYYGNYLLENTAFCSLLLSSIDFNGGRSGFCRDDRLGGRWVAVRYDRFVHSCPDIRPRDCFRLHRTGQTKPRRLPGRCSYMAGRLHVDFYQPARRNIHALRIGQGL